MGLSLRSLLLALVLILLALHSADSRPQRALKASSKKSKNAKGVHKGRRKSYVYKNPPNTTMCPQFPAAAAPGLWANGARILATPGWFGGRFLNYRDYRSGYVQKKAMANIGAAECFNQTFCATGASATGTFLSWQARTNGGTRGTCLVFADTTCSPKYNPGLFPYLSYAPNWYSTSVSRVVRGPDCPAPVSVPVKSMT